MEITKTQKAINLFKEKKYKDAFRIFKNFKPSPGFKGFTKDEIHIIELAYEGLTGKGSFYKSIGIDTEQAFREAKDIIQIKYNFVV